MTVRVALQRVTTSRNGKRVTVQPGEAFNFTSEELEALDGQTPPAIRRPVQEEVPPSPEPEAPARAGRKSKPVVTGDDL